MAISQTTAVALSKTSTESEPKIWVLGGRSKNADRSIAWDAPFPNFADPDILVINLDTLDDQAIQGMDKGKLQKAMLDINDKFMHGNATLIVIASNHPNKKGSQNYIMSPVSFSTVPVQEEHDIKIESGHPFTQYLNKVKSFDFYLDNFNIAPEILAKLKGEKTDVKLETLPNTTATDNAGRILSIGYRISFNHGSQKYQSGQLIVLPTCRDLPPDETVDSVIETFRRADVKESPPLWVESIPLEGLAQVNSIIKQLLAKKATLDARLALEEQKRADIADNLRLLFTKGTQLEDAVSKALRLLGFDEINIVRENDAPSCIFKFETLGRYEYGIMGVVGADERITSSHLTQCSRWTDEYFEAKKKPSKAILITNQYRLHEYPESVEKRKQFEPGELEYAKMKDICILPSYVLFETVSDSLKDIKKSRAYLEEKVAFASGLLDRL